MRTYDFVTIDVFTSTRFAGNPLAVVLDATGLSDPVMQAIATEFNYSETTFVLPARDPTHTAQIRIFNRQHEMDFAGHPNVGTALVLAARRDECQFLFEERAGLVPVDVTPHPAGGRAIARVGAPKPLSVITSLPVQAVSECLGLSVEDVRTDLHAPIVASVGAPFGLVPVHRDALSRITPRPSAVTRLIASDPLLRGRAALFVYAEDDEPGEMAARMFAPLEGTAEDPATGSAAAALAAYRLSLLQAERLELRIRQGVQMGRPSELIASARRAGEIRASVAGTGVEILQGTFCV